MAKNIVYSLIYAWFYIVGYQMLHIPTFFSLSKTSKQV